MVRTGAVKPLVASSPEGVSGVVSRPDQANDGSPRPSRPGRRSRAAARTRSAESTSRASARLADIHAAASAMTGGDAIKPVVLFDGSSNTQEAY